MDTVRDGVCSVKRWPSLKKEKKVRQWRSTMPGWRSFTRMGVAWFEGLGFTGLGFRVKGL
jgi:hypothetical protein